MRLGVEAKWLHRGPPSGRRVVQNLVRELAAAAAERGAELHLFVPRGFDEDAAAFAGVHRVWDGNNGLSNVCVVPRVADRLRLDAVVYQNFVPPSAAHARVAFVHDTIFATSPALFPWRERAYFAPLRWLTPRAERVCTVSASERARLVRHGYAAAGRVDVVPNAVDAQFVPLGELPAAEVRRVRERLALPARYVLYAGRVTARKNVATLVRAAARLRTRLPLVVAGAEDGTCAPLAEVAAEAGAEVRLLGAVDDATLRVLYAAATVFCSPSLDEGFGLTPLEAMAAGVPVVTSRAPALVETCGGAAVHADPTDPDALAEAIDRLASDAARHAATAAAGRRRAADFTWARSARLLLDSARAAVAG